MPGQNRVARNRKEDVAVREARIEAGLDRLAAMLPGPVLPSYLKAAMPPSPKAGQTVFVTDATGGATLAFYTGAAWRMVTNAALS